MTFYFRLSLADEEYVEFSNVAQDRILGTKAETASVSLSICYLIQISINHVQKRTFFLNFSGTIPIFLFLKFLFELL